MNAISIANRISLASLAIIAIGVMTTAFVAHPLAAQSAATDVLYACYNPSGNVYRVEPTNGVAACHSESHTLFSWNHTGATGAKGEVGKAGPQGQTGDQGERGDKGAKGADGERGSTGAQGSAGADGAKGETGGPGAEGSKGPDGDKGNPGERGEKGATGGKGAVGDKGLSGPKGDAGRPSFRGYNIKTRSYTLTNFESDDPYETWVECDPGERVIGGGYKRTGFATAFARSSRPSNAVTWAVDFTIQAHVSTTITIYAICVEDITP